MSVRHSTKSEWRGMRVVLYTGAHRVPRSSSSSGKHWKDKTLVYHMLKCSPSSSVCRAASSPITDDISGSRSLALALAAAEQQYQKP